MGREKRALVVTLLLILAVVLATGLCRHGPNDEETVLATLDQGGAGAIAMSSPRPLSITARAPEPDTEAGDLAASRGPAAVEQGGAAAPTPAAPETRVPEPAVAAASREPVPTASTTPELRSPATVAAPETPGARENQATAGSDDEGRLPGVVIDSRDVDLDRYLHLVESMGALFVLMNDNRLGPRISLRRGMALPGGLPGNLVRERPHVITDPRLLQRLGTVSLPADARRDRLLLLLTRRADRALWRDVADALSSKGLARSSVALVTGAWVESGRRISIRFDAATPRDGGSTVRLSEAGREEASR